MSRSWWSLGALVLVALVACEPSHANDVPCEGAAASCQSNDDCGGFQCVAGCCALVPVCARDADCVPGQHCIGGLCTVQTSGGCASSADCAAPTPACDPASGRCVECASDADCADGSTVCQANRCVAGSSTPDGGSDAGTSGGADGGSGGACTPSVVISQLFGGGGNSGAPFKEDFVELHNRGADAVVLDGWSVQYASATGSSWHATPLAGSIAAGGYFLVGEHAGTTGAALPAADVTGTSDLSSSSGKVALVDNASVLAAACPTGGAVVDLVGYGAATCSEGSAAPLLDSSSAATRLASGCAATDDNSADFTTAAPTPRSSATAANACRCP